MTEEPKRDREWEHWPGRRAGDDGIRHRLRALFSATDDDALEERIEEQGRQIEVHADQLQATITDLERREARTAQLRSAVEDMLRTGSAELDERHAALTQLSLDLASREEMIRATERDIAVRKQELGAVELRRAAVERREALAAQRETELEAIAADLARRTRDLTDERAAPTSEPSPSQGSLLFLPGSSAYRTIDRPDTLFRVGEGVTVDGSAYVVTRVGRSPLTGDRRQWTYVDRPSSGTGS